MAMGETIEEIRRNYKENLKANDYHKHIGDGGLVDDVTASLTCLHKLVKSGRFKGNKLLEIGSGPTIHNIASAASYFTEIVQSDFVEDNCEELRKWHRGESELDWSSFLKIVAKIEGTDDSSSGLREIEDRIRKSVKAVVHCDLLLDDVVPREFAKEYDLVLTSLTVETVAYDFESFVAIMKRFNRLLRPGGGLVMIGFLNGGNWKIFGTDCEFHHFKVTKEEVDKALDMAGFAEKEWMLIPKENTAYECDAYYYVAAAKM